MSPSDYVSYSALDYIFDSMFAWSVLTLGLCLLLLAVVIVILRMFGMRIPLELKWKQGEIRYSLRGGLLGFWWEIWTPKWHDGRGKYITIGMGLIAFYRGY